MKKLDRSKPFGTVHGVHAASYEQDGVHFDAAGNEVGADASWVRPVLEGNAQHAIDHVTDSTLDLKKLNELREAEVTGKNRKTVLAAIDEATAALDAAGNEVGAGTATVAAAGATDQVSQQLGQE